MITPADKEIIKYEAYKCLIKLKINKFPIDINAAVIDSNNILISLAGMEEILGEKVEDIYENTEYGMSFFLPQLNKYGVLYNSALPYGTRRWIKAHEYGHIQLGHLASVNMMLNDPISDPDFEEEAELFARYFLCPDIILENFLFSLPNAEFISELCGIPVNKALIQEKYLKKKYRAFLFFNDNWKPNEIEAALIKQFLPFFQQRSKRIK